MPVYEYRCQACGKKFEKLVRSLSGHVAIVCPKCGSEEIEKAISLFGVGGAAKSAPSCGPGPI